MKSLILAAGHGSRLRALAESKPLATVAGVPLIEHVVRGAAAAGSREFVVVTGHCADPLEAFLSGLQQRAGVHIETVRIADWDLPNGHSVVAGAERIDGEYLLLMADHLFDPAILRRLTAMGDVDGVCLAVDRNRANPLTDIDDATKVAVGPDGAILSIGKTLADYDAIDTGLFRAGPALARAVREAFAEGRPGSLSDGVQRLADQGKAVTMDVGEAWWIDVDDPRAHALAEAQLGRRPAELRDDAA